MGIEEEFSDELRQQAAKEMKACLSSAERTMTRLNQIKDHQETVWPEIRNSPTWLFLSIENCKLLIFTLRKTLETLPPLPEPAIAASRMTPEQAQHLVWQIFGPTLYKPTR